MGKAARGSIGRGWRAAGADRRDRILGNPFVLVNPNDPAARNDVIEYLGKQRILRALRSAKSGESHNGSRRL